MSAFINTNINSLTAQHSLNKAQQSQEASTEKLASSKRINSAADDAAGMMIAALMTSQVDGMNQAIRNVYDGISLSQTAEGALSTSSDMLGRVRELAVQASNATYSASDRQAIQDEVNQILGEMDRVAGTTSFNGQKLLDGSIGAQTFQVGANAGDTVSIGATNFRTANYGNNRLESTATVGAQAGASTFTVAGGTGTAVVNVQAGASARDLAQAINQQTETTGVTASAVTEVNLGNLAAGQTYGFTLQSANAEPVSVSFTVGEQGELSEAAKAFNEQAAKTGVKAVVDANTGGVKLTNNAGDTIAMAAVPNPDREPAAAPTMAAYNADNTLSAPVTVSQDTTAMTESAGRVTVESPATFEIRQDPPPGAAGLAISGASNLDSVASISVANFEDAQQAISTVDSALTALSSERARYGAIQNRFESMANNLMVNAEKTASARSRIEDTNYADEISKNTSAIILKQVNIAMQAQANQNPQKVLSLLQ